MPHARLTQSRIDALAHRKAPYDVRDRDLKGFGLRVSPSGARRFFVHGQHQGRRVWKTLGDAGCMELGEARRQAAALLASLRAGETQDQPRLFEAVAEEVFERYSRHWKPRTLRVNRGYLRRQILPWFRGCDIAAITSRDVQRWFASLSSTPAAADRAAPVLSVILSQAGTYGYRAQGDNPCAGLRRYRRRGRERFLSEPELRRLGIALDAHDATDPRGAAFIRLLLLTGCRKSEILTLQWADYREGRLFLPDSKTGPRTVWLSSHARAILDSLPRRGKWVFPSTRRPGPLSAPVFETLWRRVRKEAGIADVRLHDLRHTFASIAVMQGETVTTTARLLGHTNPATTLKYAHLRDDDARRAADNIAPLLAGR